MEVIGRDGDAYLVADGPVGAIIGPGLPRESIVLPVASITAHREFDPYDGALPRGLASADLAKRLADARAAWDAELRSSDTSSAGVA